MSAASLGNGSAESPWKERVQSIFSSGALSSSSGLSESPLLEMLSVVGRLGVGALILLAGEPVVAGVGLGLGGVLLLLCVFWARRGVVLRARVLIGLVMRCTVSRVRVAAVACWRVSSDRQGRQRSVDMLG